MAQDNEEFLSRWSRRKREAEKDSAADRRAPAPAPAAERPAALPPLETLNLESDFRAYMQSQVDETLRRAALKKLFSDPRFNVMDGLDIYIDDYTRGEAISEEMLARLEHARQTLFGAQSRQAEGDGAPAGAAPQADAAPKGNDAATAATQPAAPAGDQVDKDGAAG